VDIYGPKAIGTFWKWFGSCSKLDPAAIGREHRKGNASKYNSWSKTQQRQCPPRVLQCHPQCKQSMTTVSSIVQWVCIHSKSIVFFSSVLIYSNCASPQLIVSWSTVYTCTISPQWTVSWSTMHSYTVEIPHVLEFC
jgi:hypothetical protein